MAAATIDDALGNLALEMWSDSQVFESLIEEDWFFGVVDKDFAAYGDPIVGAITHGGDGGTGSTLADAQATYNSSNDLKWQLGLYDEHAVFQITNKAKLTMQKAGGSAMADGLEHVMGKAMAKFKRNLAVDWWRNFGGSRGVIASGEGTATITLATPDDVIHFEVGDYIESDDTDGTTGGTADGEYIRIAGKDPIAGTLTKAGAAWNASGNFAAADNLFLRGTLGLKPQGIPDWIPSSDPGATLFNGVDRTANLPALSGIRLTASAAVDGTMASALRRACAATQRFGGRITDIALSPLNWDQVARELGNPTPVIVNATNMKGGVMAQIGYPVIILQTVKGAVNLHSTVQLNNGRAYGIDRKSWKIIGNRAPGLDKHDGKAMLRMPTTAALEGRFEAYINLMCRVPGNNFTIDLSPVQVLP